MCHPGPRPTRRPRPHPQAWDFDALGNWDSITTDGGSPQTRTHNKQNEITAVSGATSPTFDANGNMTTDETGKQYVYDAWNRLKVVKNSGGTTLKTYVYDALNRRVAETAGGATTDLYYSANWQVLEERDTARTNDTKARYVWSPVYVDAMILRDRDTADDGTLEERLWVQQDANFNVTALVDNNGDVVERYVYDPYGVATVLNASWSSIGSSAYTWMYLHQGGRLDGASELYHFRNRDYSPTLGRWVTMDPIRYYSGDGNLYRYASATPLDKLDPLGLDDNPYDIYITFGSDAGTGVAAFWHSLGATVTPFVTLWILDGAITVKSRSLLDSIYQLKERLGDCDCISSLTFAGHGSAGSWWLNSNGGRGGPEKKRGGPYVLTEADLDAYYRSSREQQIGAAIGGLGMGTMTYTQREKHIIKAFDWLKSKICPGKKITIDLMICSQAAGTWVPADKKFDENGKRFCMKLSLILNATVSANDGEVYGWGRGTWWIIEPDGSVRKK